MQRSELCGSTFAELMEAAQREGESDRAPTFESEAPGAGADGAAPEGPGLLAMVMCAVAAISTTREDVRELAACTREMAETVRRLSDENRRLAAQLAEVTDSHRREEQVVDCLCSRVDRLHCA